MKVKTILVSQPAPKTETSPYFDLSDKQKVKIDFRSFIHVEGIPVKEIRTQKIDLSNFTAIDPIRHQTEFFLQKFLNSCKNKCLFSFSEGGLYSLPFELIPPQYSGKNKNFTS